MRSTRWVSAAATGLLAMGAMGMAGCAGADQPEVSVIDITASGFRPATMTIAPGDEVRWVNRVPGRTAITSTSDDAQGMNGVPEGAEPIESGPLREGDTYATRLTTPGTYVYWIDGSDQRDRVGAIRVEEGS